MKTHARMQLTRIESSLTIAQNPETSDRFKIYPVPKPHLQRYRKGGVL